ncbi:hypothetical protein CMsap09_06215 [Clavibacter michiganensis]|uniref:Uncharacterized protein n=1 Tax=Clavibacter michiganensis TaxID=28447 RepID=A0A251XSJ2_9MICO|nr:hypothetical protein CMsap09_06215 [Clavibacter michiganensis]
MMRSRSSRLYLFTGHWPVPMLMPLVKAVPKSNATRPSFASSVAPFGSDGL